MKTNKKDNLNKRLSSAESLSRSSSPLLSPVKEEREHIEEDDKGYHGTDTSLFTISQESYIKDLLEKQARRFERQQEQNNDYLDRQMDRLMTQLTDMSNARNTLPAPQVDIQAASYATPHHIQKRMKKSSWRPPKSYALMISHIRNSCNLQNYHRVHRPQATLWKRQWKTY
jgi:hypothetical protein